MSTSKSVRSLLRWAAVSVMCLSWWWATAATADGFKPVPLPDPGIQGYTFPEPEDTILKWVADNNQAAINLHAWGLWTSLTTETDETYAGQKLRVFETWLTPQDILAGETTQPARSQTPRPFAALRQLTRHPGARLAGEPTVLGFVKYDPTAAKHIIDNNLLSVKALNTLLDAGKSEIPDFPVTAVSLKPVFQPIARQDLVGGRYYQLAAWPGPPGKTPPGPSVPFPSSVWKQCVWIDIQNEGQGSGDVDQKCDPSGASRTPQNTYNVDSLINFVLTQEEAQLLNASNLAQWEQAVQQAKQQKQPPPAKPNPLAAGDYSILQAMHVTSREITRWTWQTFWWTPTPDNPHFPSSPAIAEDRPAQLTGAPRNYAHAPAYSMLYPPQPNTGGKNEGNSVYAYNPWLEAGFSKSVLPDSIPGTYNGKPVQNNVGIQTNCMSCHAQANFSPQNLPTAPNYTGDRYIDLNSPQFNGTLKVDFLWSIPGNAK